MTTPRIPDDEHPIDGAVRAHLLHEASGVDSGAMLARVKAAGVVPAGSTRRAWLKWAAGAGVATGGAVAAGVYLNFGGEGPVPVRPLSAAELVAEAKVVHARPHDRKYRVQVEFDPPAMPVARPLFPGQPLPPPPPPLLRDSVLWTRGDIFWLESTGQFGKNWTWGRDTTGRIWVAMDRKLGMVFEKDETGEPVARACEMMGVRIPALLDEITTDADLAREDSGGAVEPYRVSATFRFGPRMFPVRKVTLWIDREVKVVQKMVIERLFQGQPVTTFTFTLLESGTIDDKLYEIAGHLDENGRVLDKRAPLRERVRQELLLRFLPGPPGARGKI